MFLCRRLVVKGKEGTIVNISFSIEHSLALVGESGSGKSITLKALLGLLPKGLEREIDLEWEYPLIRGKTLSLVPQDPFTSLSPLTTIRDQFFSDEAPELLKMVGLDESFLDRYPPQLSGGQVQRVVIAMALSHHPKLLLLDEPTTALDPRTKEMVLALFRRLQEQMGFLILFVTHDIESARQLCREVAVIRSGTIVERGPMEEVLRAPKSPYTRELIEANFAHRKFRQ
ncbi:MAG: ABC transporter ATP-binding protein [Epsilonproteobacteria bacterium]|nr:ABC transporter ATP-binding protein [Campylobacterota bacterium]NPA56298.1 ABC transporter ATP-binding protein [Campylobacterota bacterium]